MWVLCRQFHVCGHLDPNPSSVFSLRQAYPVCWMIPDRQASPPLSFKRNSIGLQGTGGVLPLAKKVSSRHWGQDIAGSSRSVLQFCCTKAHGDKPELSTADRRFCSGTLTWQDQAFTLGNKTPGPLVSEESHEACIVCGI